jgi:aspartate 1-decarboxylase
MQRIMLKSKIHRATVTDANLNYEGSITIDEGLMKSADLVPFEKVAIYNVSNGERFSTYVIKGKWETPSLRSGLRSASTWTERTR